MFISPVSQIWVLRATPLAEKGLSHDVCWAVQVIRWPEGYQRWRGRLLLCHYSPGRLWEPGQHPDFHFIPTGPELASAGETVCRNWPLLQEQSSNSCFHHAINYCHWYKLCAFLRKPPLPQSIVYQMLNTADCSLATRLDSAKPQWALLQIHLKIPLNLGVKVSSTL